MKSRHKETLANSQTFPGQFIWRVIRYSLCVPQMLDCNWLGRAAKRSDGLWEYPFPMDDLQGENDKTKTNTNRIQQLRLWQHQHQWIWQPNRCHGWLARSGMTGSVAAVQLGLCSERPGSGSGWWRRCSMVASTAWSWRGAENRWYKIEVVDYYIRNIEWGCCVYIWLR